MTKVDQLKLFLHSVQELKTSNFVKCKFENNFKISFDSQVGMEISCTQPEEESLRSYLLTFRRFVSQQEPIYLYKIHNLCFQSINQEDIQRHLSTARSDVKEMFKKYGFSLVLNNTEILPEYALDLWINGHYFHNDQSKLAMLQKLQPIESLLVRYKFIDLIIDVSNYLFFLDRTIQYCLKNGKFIVSN